jgi:hypothetical protein
MINHVIKNSTLDIGQQYKTHLVDELDGNKVRLKDSGRSGHDLAVGDSKLGSAYKHPDITQSRSCLAVYSFA